MLRMDPDKVCYLVVKAREFDVKVAPEGAYEGSNPSDDGTMVILEDYPDDPTLEELTAALKGLNVDEVEDVVALMLVGRGDASKDDWDGAIAEAQSIIDEQVVEMLLGIPLLSDYLENGLSELGHSCEDFEMGHL